MESRREVSKDIQIEFREAGVNDLATLNKISVQSKAHWEYPIEWMDRWKHELMLDEIDFEQQKILAAENDNQIIGFSAIANDTDHYEIGHLWVLPEYIGKGVGKRLLVETIERYVETAKPIIVETDPNAEPFYKSQGFVTFDQIESYPKGRYLPVMRKRV